MRREGDRVDGGQPAVDVQYKPVVRIDVHLNGIRHRGFDQPLVVGTAFFSSSRFAFFTTGWPVLSERGRAETDAESDKCGGA